MILSLTYCYYDKKELSNIKKKLIFYGIVTAIIVLVWFKEVNKILVRSACGTKYRYILVWVSERHLKYLRTDGRTADTYWYSNLDLVLRHNFNIFKQMHRQLCFMITGGLKYIKSKLISFTLHPARSRVGTGNLVLHFVPHFPQNSEGIACWVAELNATFCLDTRAKKRKYKLK